MMKMYEGIPFSPTAELTGVVAVDDTVISVSNTACFPPAPNYATIGIDENAETILYTQKTQNTLSGCTRGVEGVAKSWEQGELIARNFTNKDYQNLIDNINNKVEKNKILNPNLLINGDFKIWQRGTSFETPGGRYTADRWICPTYSHISKSNNGLLIKGNYIDGLGSISQILTREEVGDISGSLTCSFVSHNFVPINLEINIDGVITNQPTGTSTNFIKSSITFHLPDNFQRLKLSLIVGGGGVPSLDLAEIKWCKLEVGEVATPFVPRPYAQELALCQRYYNVFQISAPVVGGWGNPEGTYFWTIATNKTFTTTLRVIPTIHLLEPFVVNGVGGGFTNDSISHYIMTQNEMEAMILKNMVHVPSLDCSIGGFKIGTDAEIY